MIFLIAFLLYILKEKAGKYFLLIWLFLWSVTQFFSHEWFTIMGNGEGKIQYFNCSSTGYNSDFLYKGKTVQTVMRRGIFSGQFGRYDYPRPYLQNCPHFMSTELYGIIFKNIV
ncbi:hypothetical protein EDD76_1224 [Kineothrix alysoides]|uniref:Uncharacterized protein n=1 Tax=Kineothrix alysoides TaxID=1469948 RepID=A0A4R1QKC0_9FIRM|nr:hypothetical protein [Kineothrix alysoides]TCL54088.1 hypothetical protein EDD76_1224 [Kineothrix alysoides]